MTRHLQASLVAAVILTFAASSSPAQEPSTPETYGTASLSIHTISAAGFRHTIHFSNGPDLNQDLQRYVYGPGAFFVAPLSLPSGAFINHIELEVCDDAGGPGDDAEALIVRCPRIGGCIFTTPASTFITPLNGCGHVSSAPLNLFVDNHSYSYQVEVEASGPGDDVRFRAVRVYYRLLVSAAPTTATFTDVPVSHPFHRFVEALSAAGITAGCAPTLYCPDVPLTRGQMAVFLSVALGLHFP